MMAFIKLINKWHKLDLIQLFNTDLHFNEANGNKC